MTIGLFHRGIFAKIRQWWREFFATTFSNFILSSIAGLV